MCDLSSIFIQTLLDSYLEVKDLYENISRNEYTTLALVLPNKSIPPLLLCLLVLSLEPSPFHLSVPTDK